MQRRGEALSLLVDEQPTSGYFPLALYHLGVAREGLNNPGFRKAYEQYLNIRGNSTEDSARAANQETARPILKERTPSARHAEYRELSARLSQLERGSRAQNRTPKLIRNIRGVVNAKRLSGVPKFGL